MLSREKVEVSICVRTRGGGSPGAGASHFTFPDVASANRNDNADLTTRPENFCFSHSDARRVVRHLSSLAAWKTANKRQAHRQVNFTRPPSRRNALSSNISWGGCAIETPSK